MNGRVTATIFYYCFAVIIVYLIVLVFFDTAENIYPNEFKRVTEMDRLLEPKNESSSSKTDDVGPYTTLKPLLPCDDMAKVALRNLSTNTLFESFYWCAYPLWARFSGLPEQGLINWPYLVWVCDEEEELMKIPVVPYPTLNKTYWGIEPQCRDTHVLVTLGIRNDSVAVRKMKETWRSLVTFGTSATGTRSPEYDHFFNYAFGVNGTGIETVFDGDGKIVKLRQKSVKSFFKYSIKAQRIDMLWINVEASEFEYWKYFFDENNFAGLGIAVCQINIEINPNDGAHFEKFLLSIYATRQFVFMRPSVTQKERITRVFLVNIRDTICVRKYLK